MERFIDENLTISDFSNVIFVICPKCKEKATVRKKRFGNFKFVCEKCGLIRIK